jgi:hypothetical protein
MDSENTIEEMGQANAMRFGHEPELMPVPIETPGSPLGDDLDAWLVISIKQLVRDLATGVLIGKLESLRSEPLHIDNRDKTIRENSLHSSVRLKLFELSHPVPRFLIYATGITGVIVGSPILPFAVPLHSRRLRLRPHSNRKAFDPRQADNARFRLKPGFLRLFAAFFKAQPHLRCKRGPSPAIPKVTDMQFFRSLPPSGLYRISLLAPQFRY